MRLIDADELKKCAIPCEIHNGALTDLCVPLYQIDNAPTVKPSLNLDNITEDDIKKFKMIWQRATSKGLLVINEERSPGKWIYKCCYGDEYPQCSNCGEIFDEKSNFCPDCGADMRGEENGK